MRDKGAEVTNEENLAKTYTPERTPGIMRTNDKRTHTHKSNLVHTKAREKSHTLGDEFSERVLFSFLSPFVNKH